MKIKELKAISSYFLSTLPVKGIGKVLLVGVFSLFLYLCYT